MVVPFAYEVANCYFVITKKSTSELGVSIHFISFLLLIVLLLIASLFIKFNIRMLRNKNKNWNLDNDIHFYGFIYLAIKAFFIALSQTTPLICLVGLAIWYYHHQMLGGPVDNIQRMIEYIPYHFVAIADFAALVSLLSHNSNFGFCVWIFSAICIIFYNCLFYYHHTHKKLFIPLCSSRV
jgi:hypothetical protein